MTGEVLPAGETGELVITTLQRRAMPLLRYRTGDMASLLDGPQPAAARCRAWGRCWGASSAMDGIFG